MSAMRSRDWRVICDCQNHRARNSRVASSLRKAAGAIVVMIPLAYGAFAVPVDALSTEMQTKAPAEIPLAGEEPMLLNMAAGTDRKALSILTPNVRRTFLEVTESKHSLDVERFRENFFRTTIPYGDIIYREARRNGLPPELVAAVIETESNFRPRRVSHKNAQGLMQLIPSTGRMMGASNLFHPAENIRAGTRYLRYLNRRFPGNSTLVLAAYNAGETVVGRLGGVPPYRETEQYLKKVSSRRSEYQRKADRAVAAYVRLHTRSSMH
jgi:soluble lytic murein transglycosylase-like protein